MAAPIHGQQASLSDILTAAQNLVRAVNNLAQIYQNVNGTTSTEGIAAATVVKGAPGRVATVSVTTAGAAGVIYDSAVLGVTTRPLWPIPDVAGAYIVNMAADYGILVVPGSAQVVAVCWS